MTIKSKRYLIILTILFIVGSFFTFYFTNLVMDSVSGTNSPYFILGFTTSISGLIIPIDFIMAFLFFCRFYLHPTHKKRFLFIYGLVASAISVIGLVLIIISGACFYHSFTKPYPFAGYHVIILIYHILMIAFGLILAFVIKNKIKEDDIVVHKTNAFHILFTFVLSLLLFFIFNRFGAFLWFPVYVQWSMFGQISIFLLSLLFLGLMIFNLGFYACFVYRGKKGANVGLGITIGLSVGSILFIILTIVFGLNSQAFVSAISPAVPIERLLTKPIDVILQLIVVIGLSIFSIIYAVRFKIKADKKKD